MSYFAHYLMHQSNRSVDVTDFVLSPGTHSKFRHAFGTTPLELMGRLLSPSNDNHFSDDSDSNDKPFSCPAVIISGTAATEADLSPPESCKTIIEPGRNAMRVAQEMSRAGGR